ncbi:MAG TPA: hypothetical protein VK539_33230 [Myxococcaceae bacterium]|nr:hypothetical protein [Myxococcaceae bacterium]
MAADTRWREQLRGSAAVVLDMIVGDIGLTIAAKRYRIHNRRARQQLLEALDAWPRIFLSHGIQYMPRAIQQR